MRTVAITSVDFALGDQQPFDGVLAFPRLGQQEFRAAADDGHPVPEEFLQHLLNRHRLRPIADERQENHAEGDLQRRILEKLVEDDFAVGIALEHNVQPHLPFGRLAVGIVDDPCDPLDSLVANQVLQLFFQPVARFEIGNLGDDDHVGILLGLEMRGGPQRDRRAAREITLADPFAAADDAPRRESGPGITSSRSSIVQSGSSMIWITASATSFKLCGGMLVAMPTAIPSSR